MVAIRTKNARAVDKTSGTHVRLDLFTIEDMFTLKIHVFRPPKKGS